MSFKDKINNINIDEKGIQHDLISIKDSLLNSELLNINIYYYSISSFYFSDKSTSIENLCKVV